VRVNPQTGVLARPGDKNVILEAFKDGTQPSTRASIIEGESWTDGSGEGGFLAAPSTGTGGLY
jgi:penicillin-binding protein 1A